MRDIANDATTALLRALRRKFTPPIALRLEAIKSRSWASATFVGARHEIVFDLSGSGAETAADGFIAGLEAAEFPLRGHILADIALVARQSLGHDQIRISIEALTVEDA